MGKEGVGILGEVIERVGNIISGVRNFGRGFSCIFNGF